MKKHISKVTKRQFSFRILNRLRHFNSSMAMRFQQYESGVLEAAIPALLRSSTAYCFEPCPFEVHMLLSGKNLLMGLWAARSFQYFTKLNWIFVFTNDGSIDANGVQLLSRLFPGCKVISKDDSDRAIDSALSQYPACQSARRQHVMFKKLFDPFFHSTGDRYILLDSDVLFFQTPFEVLEWSLSDDPGFWFNPDSDTCYSVRSELLEEFFQIKLWERANAGFALVPRASVDLSVVEAYLANFANHSTHDLWLEQTAYALLASIYGKGGLLPTSYEISFGPQRSQGCISRHYVGHAASRPHFFREGVIHLAPLLLNS